MDEVMYKKVERQLAEIIRIMNGLSPEGFENKKFNDPFFNKGFSLLLAICIEAEKSKINSADFRTQNHFELNAYNMVTLTEKQIAQMTVDLMKELKDDPEKNKYFPDLKNKYFPDFEAVYQEQKSRLKELSRPELWDADENCDCEIVEKMGGGVTCKKCGGWCCY